MRKRPRGEATLFMATLFMGLLGDQPQTHGEFGGAVRNAKSGKQAEADTCGGFA
jgi:hypothetical protein